MGKTILLDNTFYTQFVDIRTTDCRPLKKKLTAVDLFCGCGGLSLGLQQAGIDVLLGVEIKEAASATCVHNLNHPVITDDITLDATKQKICKVIEESTDGNGVDIVVGGPPCQGFSMAGFRLIDDPRNKLYKEFVSIVKLLHPKYIVMENVEGMLTLGDGKIIRQIVEDFESLGYDVSVRVLNSADYGTPQNRKRTIIIGNRVEAQNYYPLPILLEERYKTVRDAISDLEDYPEDRAFSQIYTKHNSAKIERISKLKEGDKYSQKYNGTLRRLYYDKPSPTVTYSHGNPDIHPKCNRVLTLRELARLQGFPDTFMFFGSKDAQGTMISNAVPPQLGRAIGCAIIEMEHTRNSMH